MHRSPSLSPVLFVLLACAALVWLVRDVLAPGSVGGDIRPSSVATQPGFVPTTVSQATVAPAFVPTAPPRQTPELLSLTPVALQPSPTVATASIIVGYSGYTVREADTLATIARAVGSTPELIASYNLLRGDPQPGRALIIPQIAQTDALPGEPLLVKHGRTDKPLVALTLDAGGSAESTALVLRALRERSVTITFFLTGTWMRENPALTRQIVADGHEIANHTMTHSDLTRLGDDAIREELTATEATLHEIAGENVNIRPFFRPPYGAYDERVLRVVESEGYLPIYWTLDSLDSVGEPKTAAFLVERVTTKLPEAKLRGAIILAHCGFTWTAEALPTILDRFAEMGFQVTKLSEVL